MSILVVPTGKAKYSWQEVSRIGPPKRESKERVEDFCEIYSLYDEETIRQQASRCIGCPEATCMAGCPLNNKIPEWMALAAEGRFLEAAQVSQSTSNMPEICSRICPQERLCESNCLLHVHTDPVCIGAIERFINEYAFAHGGVDTSIAQPNGFEVAVVGSGPGGMACADELAKRGYAVTIFEASQTPGGLLVNGIPSFKLEKKIVDRRLNVLRARGVEIKLGQRLGQNLSLTDLQDKFDAIFLAIGAQKHKPLRIPGAELDNVFESLPFLVEKNIGAQEEAKEIEIKDKRVAVLGGGDTAMDCLRTAIRAGAAEAVCLYRRDFDNMPGSRKEYVNAVEEGAHFEFLTNPVELLGTAREGVKKVRCVRMELGEPDASGRRRPRPIADSEFEVPADIVIVAYGFDPEPFPEDSDLAQIKVNSWGGVMVDDHKMTSVPGVFAGGDIIRGPSLVVHAVRDARDAALEIHEYLMAKSVSL